MELGDLLSPLVEKMIDWYRRREQHQADEPFGKEKEQGLSH